MKHSNGLEGTSAAHAHFPVKRTGPISHIRPTTSDGDRRLPITLFSFFSGGRAGSNLECNGPILLRQIDFFLMGKGFETRSPAHGSKEEDARMELGKKDGMHNCETIFTATTYK